MDLASASFFDVSWNNCFALDKLIPSKPRKIGTRKTRGFYGHESTRGSAQEYPNSRGSSLAGLRGLTRQIISGHEVLRSHGSGRVQF